MNDIEENEKQIDIIATEIMKTIDKKFQDMDQNFIMAAFGRCIVMGSQFLEMNEGDFQEFLFHVESEFMQFLKMRNRANK
jgi:hypothetical protein